MNHFLVEQAIRDPAGTLNRLDRLEQMAIERSMCRQWQTETEWAFDLVRSLVQHGVERQSAEAANAVSAGY